MAKSIITNRRSLIKAFPLFGTAIALPLTANAAGMEEEHPFKNIRRLADELSIALDGWNDGAWKAYVLPRRFERAVMFADIDSEESVRRDPHTRLHKHLSGLKQAMMEIDPRCTMWVQDYPEHDEDPIRFGLSGSRPVAV